MVDAIVWKANRAMAAVLSLSVDTALDYGWHVTIRLRYKLYGFERSSPAKAALSALYPPLCAAGDRKMTWDLLGILEFPTEKIYDLNGISFSTLVSPISKQKTWFFSSTTSFYRDRWKFCFERVTVQNQSCIKIDFH